jgi:hypothetical protein
VCDRRLSAQQRSYGRRVYDEEVFKTFGRLNRMYHHLERRLGGRMVDGWDYKKII